MADRDPEPSRGTLTAPEYREWRARVLDWRPTWREYRLWVGSHPEPGEKPPKLKGVMP